MFLRYFLPRDIRTSSYRRCRSETSVENLLHKTKHVSSRPSPVLVHESEPSIIRWSYPPGYRYHSVLIRSTSVLGHLGPWSLQTFKKDRNDRGRIDQGPKCFNHFGTQDRSVHRTWYWCSSPGITTEGELERRKSQCSTNFWVYGTEMGACSTNFFGGKWLMVCWSYTVTKNVEIPAFSQDNTLQQILGLSSYWCHHDLNIENVSFLDLPFDPSQMSWVFAGLIRSRFTRNHLAVSAIQWESREVAGDAASAGSLHTGVDGSRGWIQA